MRVIVPSLRESVIRILDELPPESIAELLDFALFLKSRSQTRRGVQKPQLKTAPASRLDGLVGLVAWGGDALVDTEGFYEK